VVACPAVRLLAVVGARSSVEMNEVYGKENVRDDRCDRGRAALACGPSQDGGRGESRGRPQDGSQVRRADPLYRCRRRPVTSRKRLAETLQTTTNCYSADAAERKWTIRQPPRRATTVVYTESRRRSVSKVWLVATISNFSPIIVTNASWSYIQRCWQVRLA
jgi:hypothetical protein